ncbi:MAG: hypothetical protein KKD38_02030 [Candidatus Delongbacteria bacterium]|nr:hypothetical protein [Candidatus Delongbacteria bacterium]
MIFLLLMLVSLYYATKGIIVKETKSLMIITTALFSINLWILFYLENSWFKTLILVYLLYSFADYLSMMFLKRQIFNIPLMSRLSIISEEAIINYNLFRPVILIPLNIFLFFKKQHFIGLNDEIGIDIKSKDGTQIKINI